MSERQHQETEPARANGVTFEQIWDGIGLDFTLVRIGLRAYGSERNWLGQVPLVGLLMLLIGILMAQHFVVKQVSSRLPATIGFLMAASQSSNWMFAPSVCAHALIGGARGWILTIRSTSETVAAASAIFGALLFSAIAVAAVSKQKELNPDCDDKDEFKPAADQLEGSAGSTEPEPGIVRNPGIGK